MLIRIVFTLREWKEKLVPGGFRISRIQISSQGTNDFVPRVLNTAAENFSGYANFAYIAPMHPIDRDMTLADFENTLTWKTPPKDLTPLLAALWHERQGNWESAHNIAQDVHTQDGSWVHAYLHRVEGDQGNASYWYRRAGKPVPQVSTNEEWRQLVTAFLTKTK